MSNENTLSSSKPTEGNADRAAGQQPALKLAGQVAVVTGGGRGMCKGIALELAEAGADIAIIETDTLDSAYNHFGTKDIQGVRYAQKVVEQIVGIGRKAIAVKCDVSHFDEVTTAVEQIVKEMGKIDIWVNGAGVQSMSFIPITDILDEAWDLVYNVNVKAHMYTAKALIPYFKTRGGGKIINVASAGGHVTGAREKMATYCSSKAAAIQFAHCLALEVAKDNIKVNVICPGGTAPTQMAFDQANLTGIPGPTPWLEDYPEETKQALEKMPYGLLGKIMTPREIGKLAVYFATAELVTGVTVNCDNLAMW
jgi:meso-butanediol dehydrogenase/(S,S)-butanediol dehydrogenase/diacetyl reductase